MGIEFGNLSRITGITFFRLSPYEQNPFSGTGAAIRSLLYRGLTKVVTIGPLFLSSYAIMEWANEENYKSHRKNPKDYENDT